MQTQVLRQQIARAIAHEQFSGSAAQMLRQAAAQHGHRPPPSEIAGTVGFIRDYIENVPDLLDACAVAANQVGISHYAMPILEAAQQYFVSPLDIIFDHFGLIGLMDDAYFAQRLLQSISDSYRLWTGRPLLPLDLGPANAVIRQLIGEPQASQLDAAIDATLERASVQRAFRGLTSYAKTLPVTAGDWDSEAVRELLEGSTGLGISEPDEEETTAESDILRPESMEIEDTAPPTESNELTAGYEMLLKLFNEKVRAGEFTPERKEALEPILEELGEVMKEKPDDLSDMMSRVARVRELMGRMTTAVDRPTYEGEAPPGGSRAERVDRLLAGVKRFLFIEGGRAHKAEDEHKTVENLFVRVAQAGTSLRQAGADDDAVIALERESLRKLALDARDYAMRHHLTLANPIWPAPPVSQDANAIFFSGGTDVQRLAAEVCGARSLELVSGGTKRNYAQERWDGLRRCNVAVFDFTSAEATELAAVCYELGIGLALGRSIVIVAPGQGRLPFDVDVVPVRLAGDGEDVRRLSDALDEALYGQQRGGGDSSIAETIAYARRVLGGDEASWEAKHTIGLLGEAADDPLKVRYLIDNLLGFSGPEAPAPLRPAWPGSYPEPGARRCFHVMPFGMDWSDEVMDLTRKACEAAGVDYVRGDAVKNPRIIRSIWDELCRASRVVVDLTGFNANVALELGIAHCLGRDTLIVGQEDTVDRLFPALAKLRVQPYSLRGSGPNLRDVLGGFLS